MVVYSASSEWLHSRPLILRHLLPLPAAHRLLFCGWRLVSTLSRQLAPCGYALQFEVAVDGLKVLDRRPRLPGCIAVVPLHQVTYCIPRPLVRDYVVDQELLFWVDAKVIEHSSFAAREQPLIIRFMPS